PAEREAKTSPICLKFRYSDFGLPLESTAFVRRDPAAARETATPAKRCSRFAPIAPRHQTPAALPNTNSLLLHRHRQCPSEVPTPTGQRSAVRATPNDCESIAGYRIRLSLAF